MEPTDIDIQNDASTILEATAAANECHSEEIVQAAFRAYLQPDKETRD
jgi:hypothetical protein